MPGFRLGGGGGGWNVVASPVAAGLGGGVCLLLALFGACVVIPQIIRNQLTGCTDPPKTYADLGRGCSSPGAATDSGSSPVTPASGGDKRSGGSASGTSSTATGVYPPVATSQLQQRVYWGFDGIPVAIGTRPDGTAIQVPYEKINWSDSRNRSIPSENVAPPVETYLGETAEENVVTTTLQEKYHRWINSNPNGEIGSFLDGLPSDEARQVVATMLPPDPKLRTKYYQRIYENEKSRR